MKEQMEKHSANITKVLEDVAAVQNDVTAVQNDVSSVQDDVTEVLGSNITKVLEDVERNSADITSLGARGHWCAYQNDWRTVGTITYDSITFSDSNMNIRVPEYVNLDSCPPVP